MENVKYEDGKLIVPTPKGDIIVSVEGGSNYPGVYIDFKSKEIKDSTVVFRDDTMQLARIEYDTNDEELRAYLWENPDKEDYSYKTIFNDALVFDENFEIMPYGTKVEYCGQVGYIMGDNRDDCSDGYCASLNYYVKYALDGETFEDVKARTESNKEQWYDIMDMWNMVKKVNVKKEREVIDMGGPIMQIREFHDGTWSVMARIWNPQKKFYEHPELINLTREEAEKHCQKFIENTPSVEEIVKDWVYIGD